MLVQSEMERRAKRLRGTLRTLRLFCSLLYAQNVQHTKALLASGDADKLDVEY